MVINHHRIIFIIFLSTIAAFAPFSTDIYLASMPIIQKEMHASVAQVQLTLSLFFIGFALAQLFWGPLSDRIGRKKTILIGVIVYIIGSLSCALSQNIFMLIFARLVQSIGACVGIVMALAIIRDCFSETGNMSKMIAITMATAMAAPMVAPVLGSYLLVHFGWQANFYVLFGYGIFLLISTLFFAETYPENKRKPLPLNKLLLAYGQQLVHKPFLLTALASSTNFCMLFSFISSSSFVYINIYDLNPEYFGYFFGGNAIMLVLGNLMSNKFKKTLSKNKLIFVFLFIALIGAILMFLAVYLAPESIWSVVLPFFLVTYCIGVLYPELMSYPLEHVVAYTGIASSLVGTMRFTSASITAFFVGFIITVSALPLAVVIIILNIFTMVMMKIYFSNKRTKK